MAFQRGAAEDLRKLCIPYYFADDARRIFEEVAKILATSLLQRLVVDHAETGVEWGAGLVKSSGILEPN